MTLSDMKCKGCGKIVIPGIKHNCKAFTIPPGRARGKPRESPTSRLRIPGRDVPMKRMEAIDDLLLSFDEGECIGAYLILTKQMKKFFPEEDWDDRGETCAVRMNEIEIDRYRYQGKQCERISFEVMYNNPGDDMVVRNLLKRGVIYLPGSNDTRNPNHVKIKVRTV